MKFNYNDVVMVRIKDDTGNIGKKPGWVVCMEPVEIENDEQVRHFGFPIGSVVYTVEFQDGTDALVAESDLQLS